MILVIIIKSYVWRLIKNFLKISDLYKIFVSLINDITDRIVEDSLNIRVDSFDEYFYQSLFVYYICQFIIIIFSVIKYTKLS
ncbi:hypothetical protein KUTeg_003388 [Tegillarca granosa]|uniref:Uncharacterized protein n=1 Tax=Tegillarca granosa TaxID=220873 RepID=A0ABQ9FQV4_TEGGR|nr:hypothetical protein KUTeg_003388 [Tegillarca granosa]